MDTVPEPARRAVAQFSPLVELTDRSLHAARPDPIGFVRPGAAGALDVTVAVASISRACQLLQALLAKSEVAGIAVRVNREHRRTIVRVDGEDIAIRLTEAKGRRKHKPTAEERAEARRPFGDRIPEWDHFPGGELALTITDPTVSGARRLWADGRRAPLERKLDSFIAGLKAFAAAIKRQRIEHEAWLRQREEEHRREVEAAERRRAEREFQDGLIAEAEGWQQSVLIRAYVDAMVEQVRSRGGPSDNAKVGPWAEHALSVADRLDPLQRVRPD